MVAHVDAYVRVIFLEIVLDNGLSPKHLQTFYLIINVLSIIRLGDDSIK